MYECDYCGSSTFCDCYSACSETKIIRLASRVTSELNYLKERVQELEDKLSLIENKTSGDMVDL